MSLRLLSLALCLSATTAWADPCRWIFNSDHPEWKRVSVRDPKAPVKDENYLPRLHASLRDVFESWFLDREPKPFDQMMQAQHRAFVEGPAGQGTYYGYSRLQQNLDQGFHASPGAYRDAIMAKDPEGRWTIQIDLARELHQQLPDRLEGLRQNYLERLKQHGLTEPTTESEFMSFAAHLPFEVQSVPVSVPGLAPEHWPSVQVFQNFVRHHYSRHRDVPLYRAQMARIMDTLREGLSRSPSLPISRTLDLLSDYAHLSATGHLFNIGNFSIAMSQINRILHWQGLRGISHANLDYQALVRGHDVFRRSFRAAVIEANPSLRTIAAPRLSTDRAFVSVVIPVFRELANGNLFRLIESFLAQDQSEFELVFLFDHPNDLAQEDSSAALAENQQTIALLQYAGGTSTSPPPVLQSLPRSQFKTLEALRRSGIEVTVIDQTSTPRNRNIGRLRAAGEQYVMDRAFQAGVDGIVAMMDGDNVVGATYISSILRELKTGATSLILPLAFRVEPGSAPTLYSSTYLERYWFAWEQLHAALVDRPHESVAGSQIVATTSALRRVGGVPQLYKHEDLELAKKLAAIGNQRFATSTLVYNADRARPEGFIAARRFLEMNTGSQWNWLHPHFSPLRILLGESLQIEKARSGVIAMQAARRAFHFYGFSFDQNRWADVGSAPSGPEALRRYFGEVSQDLESVHPDQDLLDWMYDHFSSAERERLSSRLDKEREHHQLLAATIEYEILALLRNPSHSILPTSDAAEFFIQNQWIRPTLKEAKRLQLPDRVVIASMQSKFPDWLLSYETTPLKQRVHRLYVLAKIIHEARQDPLAWPSLNSLLKGPEFSFGEKTTP